MAWNNIRDKIQKRVEESAWTLAGMKRYERVRLELVIFAFLLCVCGLGVIENALLGKTLSIYSYSVMSGLMFITFIGKSFEFRKMYQLNKLVELTKGINKK